MVEAFEVVEEMPDEGFVFTAESAGCVGGDDAVGMPPQRMIRRQRFGRSNVEQGG